MRQNGSSNLGGSMVAGGNITINGQFDFRQADVFSVDIEIEDWDCESDFHPINAPATSSDRPHVTGWSARFD